jgi:hypothetical protein
MKKLPEVREYDAAVADEAAWAGAYTRPPFTST